MTVVEVTLKVPPPHNSGQGREGEGRLVMRGPLTRAAVSLSSQPAPQDPHQFPRLRWLCKYGVPRPADCLHNLVCPAVTRSHTGDPLARLLQGISPVPGGRPQPSSPHTQWEGGPVVIMHQSTTSITEWYFAGGGSHQQPSAMSASH